jgi:acetyl-CoA acyltransferase 2
MAITAENLAQKYGITREQCDALAMRSQQRWAACPEAGGFKDEIAPSRSQERKGVKVVDKDEHPRISTMEQLAKLPPVFKKDGVVTAANASGINDGAATLPRGGRRVGQARAASRPSRSLVSWGVGRVEPTIMGIGPVPAIRNALDRAGLKLGRDRPRRGERGLRGAVPRRARRSSASIRAKTNVNGGAIAIGHPLGASGARITAHLVYDAAPP